MVALHEVEVVIYIHGVSSDKHGRSHESEYVSLHEGIAKLHSDWPPTKIGIEWGWNFQEDTHPKQHELLTDAQRLLGLRLMNAVDDPFDITINPARALLPKIRNLIFYKVFLTCFTMSLRMAKKQSEILSQVKLLKS